MWETTSGVFVRAEAEVDRTRAGSVTSPAGSIAAAAHDLGISETTARQHLSGLYRRMGCLNAAQAAYLLGSGRLAA